MKFNRKPKSIAIIFLIICFNLICVINTTKFSAVKELSLRKNTRKKGKSSKSGIMLGKGTKTYLSKSGKNLKSLIKGKMKGRKRNQMLAKIFIGMKKDCVNVKNFAETNVAGPVKILLNPLVYIVKWVWEKTKLLLAQYKTVKEAITKVSGHLNSPVSAFVKGMLERFVKTNSGEKDEIESVTENISADLDKLEEEKDLDINKAEEIDKFNGMLGKGIESKIKIEMPSLEINKEPEKNIKDDLINNPNNLIISDKINSILDLFNSWSINPENPLLTKFVDSIYKSFIKDLLLEMNPFTSYTDQLKEALVEKQNKILGKTDEPAKNKEGQKEEGEEEEEPSQEESNALILTEGLNNIYNAIVEEAVETCIKSNDTIFEFAGAVLTKGAISIVIKFKDYFNKLIKLLNSKLTVIADATFNLESALMQDKPAEQAGAAEKQEVQKQPIQDPPEQLCQDQELQQDGGKISENKKSIYGIISSFKVLGEHVIKVFKDLFINFGNSFASCLGNVSNELFEKLIKNNSETFTNVLGLIGDMTLGVLDSVVNSLPFWSQIRGVFDIFLSMFSLISAPIEKIDSIITAANDTSEDMKKKIEDLKPENLGATLGSNFAAFTINAVKAGMAFLNIQGFESLFKFISISFSSLIFKFKEKIANQKKKENLNQILKDDLKQISNTSKLKKSKTLSDNHRKQSIERTLTGELGKKVNYESFEASKDYDENDSQKENNFKEIHKKAFIGGLMSIYKVYEGKVLPQRKDNYCPKNKNTAYNYNGLLEKCYLSSKKHSTGKPSENIGDSMSDMNDDGYSSDSSSDSQHSVGKENKPYSIRGKNYKFFDAIYTKSEFKSDFIKFKLSKAFKESDKYKDILRNVFSKDSKFEIVDKLTGKFFNS